MSDRIAVVGLGYVGLPLAVALASAGRDVIGFDTNAARVEELAKGFDRNRETPEEKLSSSGLRVTSDERALDDVDVYVVAVPTPVDRAKRPDLSHLVSASQTVGRAIGRRAERAPASPAVVVYESTVFPGCTEEVCLPMLLAASGRPRAEVRLGYSPERINPGDAEHTLERVVKVIAAEDDATLRRLEALYGSIVKAGLHAAPDIRTAEAAKVIENTQRDVNIALMNELAILFHRMGIDTREVLKAAGTKWNFLRFEPGLVGGHCIPEDPYYLTHKAEELGHHPQVILAGRRINDQMGIYVATETVKLLIRAGRPVREARVLVLGFAFKENVADVRNTRVLDLVRELETYGCNVSVHDPLVDIAVLAKHAVRAERDPLAAAGSYDAVILAVPHKLILERLAPELPRLLRRDGRPAVLVDVKAALPKHSAPSDALVWTL